MAEDTKDRIVRYLQDAHAAEVGGASSLKDIVAEATDANLKAAAQEHLTQTESQANRLEARLTALGSKPNDGKGVVNTILGKASDLLNVFHDKEDKQTQDTIKAYALENFEVGMYTSLHAYADAVGDVETATLARTIMAEEQQAAQKMLAVIPQLATYAVNKTAA